jgi:hypothetical protein
MNVKLGIRIGQIFLQNQSLVRYYRTLNLSKKVSLNLPPEVSSASCILLSDLELNRIEFQCPSSFKGGIKTAFPKFHIFSSNVLWCIEIIYKMKKMRECMERGTDTKDRK